MDNTNTLKLKVVSLQIICEAEDANTIECELLDTEAAQSFGKYCLGTEVRDLTTEEMYLLNTECNLNY